MNILRQISSLFIMLLLAACKNAGESSGDAFKTVTPVTITSVTVGKLTDTVALNATSSFLLKTSVNAVSGGYVQQITVRPGDRVSKGKVLFGIRSKESASVGNIINQVDSSFHFKGFTAIKCPANGFITQLTCQEGDYVQEGQSLAEISDAGSLVFLLELPYELTPWVSNNKQLILQLPDGQKIAGTIANSMPYVDAGSQTQNYVIRINRPVAIPENLIARVNFIRQVKNNAVSLPREAVLTNEQQTSFWIMKMTDSLTAVRIKYCLRVITACLTQLM
jgi:multidrug efflux pump subunit AcrA (membrane-fusion protein)